MPLLIANLGGEMIYILEQRLQAQNIALDKSKRGSSIVLVSLFQYYYFNLFICPALPAASVLQDVMNAMFSAKFVEELFKPQEVRASVLFKTLFRHMH